MKKLIYASEEMYAIVVLDDNFNKLGYLGDYSEASNKPVASIVDDPQTIYSSLAQANRAEGYYNNSPFTIRGYDEDYHLGVENLATGEITSKAKDYAEKTFVVTSEYNGETYYCSKIASDNYVFVKSLNNSVSRFSSAAGARRLITTLEKQSSVSFRSSDATSPEDYVSPDRVSPRDVEFSISQI